ncbi:MAG: hypothetical protein ACK2UH_08480 [Candidatus Promineifilaceae bacterium]
MIAGPAKAEISVPLQGVMFHDRDRSGEQEEGEEVIAGLELTLSSGEFTQTLITDENGAFTASVSPGYWSIAVLEASGWRTQDGAPFVFNVTGTETSVELFLGVIPTPETQTPTPEAEATEATEEGTPEGTPEASPEALFVEEAEDGVQLPVVLPVSGVSLSPAVAWGIGFGLLIVVGVVLIVIGRRGRRK